MILMHCYSRSGGTLFNKILGSLPDTVVLSEVSKYGGGFGRELEKSVTTVRSQAKRWYGIELSTNDYYNGIVELEQICIDMGKTLIVREWSWANFNVNRYYQNKPEFRLSTLEELEDKIEVKPFVLTRDNTDVWLSNGRPDHRKFFKTYWNYASKIKNTSMKLFKYESLTKNPKNFIRSFCQQFNLKFKDVTENYNEFKYVNGDSHVKNSRGFHRDKIEKLPRKPIGIKSRLALLSNSDFRKSSITFGYNLFQVFK